MKRNYDPAKRFVMCIDNSKYRTSLGLHKLYVVLPDERAAEDDCLRVINESGEDYLYSIKRFVPVELPQRVKQSWVRRVRESTMLANKPLQPTAEKARRLSGKPLAGRRMRD